MLYLISLIGFVTDKLGVFRQADAKRVIDLLFNIVLPIAIIYTFMTMAYILAVNPNILEASGMDRGAVFTATALSAFIATCLMALLSNYPFVLAPGMGLNAYFAYTVVLGMGYS